MRGSSPRPQLATTCTPVQLPVASHQRQLLSSVPAVSAPSLAALLVETRSVPASRTRHVGIVVARGIGVTAATAVTTTTTGRAAPAAAPAVSATAVAATVTAAAATTAAPCQP